MTNSGAHGFSEILYAYTSAANNNGSAFAGLNADTQWFNTTHRSRDAARAASCRWCSCWRWPARSPSRSRSPRPRARCAPTSRSSPGLLVGTILIITGLTYFPALALGPLAEGLAS